MPTIFSQVAKTFITDALSAQIAQSQSKDAPAEGMMVYAAQTMAFFIPPRDLTLSATKQRLLSTLIGFIKAYKENNDDLLTTRAIIHFLDECKGEINRAVTLAKRGTGTTEELLDQLTNFIKKFHQKAIAIQLVSHPAQDDIFSHFSVAIASYYARQTMDNTAKQGLLQNSLNDPFYTPLVDFTQKLNATIDKTWLLALRTITKISKDDAEYDELKNAIGMEKIEFLILKHDEMHAKNSGSIKGKLSESLSILPKYLDNYLKVAQKAGKDKEPEIEAAIDDAILKDEDDFMIYTPFDPSGTEQGTSLNRLSGSSLK